MNYGTQLLASIVYPWSVVLRRAIECFLCVSRSEYCQNPRPHLQGNNSLVIADTPKLNEVTKNACKLGKRITSPEFALRHG